jgi:hypothetical protein
VNENDKKTPRPAELGPHADERADYERPELMKKRSVARVTLFSGSGASGASGLTSA